MVIEDDLKYYIKKFSLTVAKNGEEALEIFKSNSFDIVLMDLHMPIMNGIEATEKTVKGIEAFINSDLLIIEIFVINRNRL